MCGQHIGQADTNKAHGFAIFKGLVGALHSLRSFRRRLPRALDNAKRMPEFSKAQRKTLRELAGQVYEADARAVLGVLEGDFLRWRANEMESSELLAAIHEFHQVQSRELWSRYQSLKDPEIVARGVALGLLSADQLPDALAAELAPLIDFFSRHKG